MEAHGYLRLHKIGTGTTATVYCAIDKEEYNRTMDRDVSKVAIKKICITKLERKNPLFPRYIEQEIKLMEDLHHPNILDLRKVFKTKENGKDYTCMVLEYCDTDLKKYLKHKHLSRISQEEAMEFMKQLVQALYYLKSKRIIHRDLKPANLLLRFENGKNILKISDFGLSKKIAQGDLTSTYCGSPMYMAPEALYNDGYGDKADLWSIGVILYQMITGTTPYSGTQVEDLKYNLSRNTFQYPIGVKHDICGPLIEGLLQKKPEDRISWDELFHYFGDEFYESLVSSIPSLPDISIYETILNCNPQTHEDTLTMLTFVLDRIVNSPNADLLGTIEKTISEKIRILLNNNISFSKTAPDAILFRYALTLAQKGALKETIGNGTRAIEFYTTAIDLLKFLSQPFGTCSEILALSKEELDFVIKKLTFRLANAKELLNIQM